MFLLITHLIPVSKGIHKKTTLSNLISENASQKEANSRATRI